MGVLFGAFVTAVIQSSAATTIMVIGFVNAKGMDLYQASAIIIGANIGTTATGFFGFFRQFKCFIIFISILFYWSYAGFC